jgi:hypothetical protein
LSEKMALANAAATKSILVQTSLIPLLVPWPRFPTFQPSEIYPPAFHSGLLMILWLCGELGSSFQSTSGPWLSLLSFCLRHSVRSKLHSYSTQIADSHPIIYYNSADTHWSCVLRHWQVTHWVSPSHYKQPMRYRRLYGN